MLTSCIALGALATALLARGDEPTLAEEPELAAAAADTIRTRGFSLDLKYQNPRGFSVTTSLGGPHRIFRPAYVTGRSHRRQGWAFAVGAAIPVGSPLFPEGLEATVRFQGRAFVREASTSHSPFVGAGVRAGLGHYNWCLAGSCSAVEPVVGVEMLVLGWEIRPRDSRAVWSTEVGMELQGPFARLTTAVRKRRRRD